MTTLLLRGAAAAWFAACGLACSIDPEPLRPDSGTARDSGAPAADAGVGGDATPGADVALDAGTGPDAGAVDDTTPIVDRPSRGTFTCSLTTPRVDLKPRQWGQWGHDMVTTTGGAAYLVRAESTPATPFDPAPVDFLASPIAANGIPGPGVRVTDGSPDDVRAPVATTRGSGFAALWIEGGAFRFAGFDAAGARVVAPVRIEAGELDDFRSRARLAEGADGGFGVAYVRPSPAGDSAELWWLSLDAGGVRRGAPRRLAQVQGVNVDPSPAVARAEGGFAVVWRDRVADRDRIVFAKVDALGAEVQAPRAIATAADADLALAGRAGFDRSRISLLAVAGGFVAAWPEVEPGDVQQGTGAHAIVRLVSLDAAGAPRAAPVAMRAATVDIDEIEPSLVRFAEDAVGVLWARGSHIYICGGCTPDHRIDLVLVDPTSLARLSEVVSVSPGPTGGLLNRDVAVVGNQILTAFEVTFHVHGEPGSAAFTCTR